MTSDILPSAKGVNPPTEGKSALPTLSTLNYRAIPLLNCAAHRQASLTGVSTPAGIPYLQGPALSGETLPADLARKAEKPVMKQAMR